MTETMSKNNGSLYPFPLPVSFITLLKIWQISVTGPAESLDKIDVYRQPKLQTSKYEQFKEGPFLYLVTRFLQSKRRDDRCNVLRESTPSIDTA
jgi:hypothetical protein